MQQKEFAIGWLTLALLISKDVVRIAQEAQRREPDAGSAG